MEKPNNMKLGYLSLYLIFLTISNCTSSQSQNLNELIVKEKEVFSILQTYIEEQEEYVDIEKSTILINIEEEKNEVELRLGLLYKEVLSSYLTGKENNVIGYFDYKDITVIVFGKYNSYLFEKTNNKKSIPFFYVKTKTKIKEGEIPPPPVVYEPIVWIYSYYNSEFNIIDKGRFTLLN